jgi:predicted nucleic acid-binding protein/GNAT superfamily N-acetyltransferase
MAAPSVLKILEGYAAVVPFLENICRAADAHRNALGFFPRSVFEEFARRDHLFALVEQGGNSCNYVGHLMFQRRFPRTHIVQMFVLPERRREGLATILLSHLRDSLTKDGFTSIYARVAEDLTEANTFWERQRFYVQRTEIGGATKKRHILVRCHELSTPQLFPPSGLKAADPLGIVPSSIDTTPLYLLDLNVLYDIAPRRLRRTEALSLFQAERMNFCQLAVSSEISEELRRTARAGKTDPMEAYVSVFPSLPFRNNASSDNLISELAELVFPTKDKLQPNDKSDLRHLATAIQHKVAGLITNDEALLVAANEIHARYEINVLSPAAFALDTYATSSGAIFSASKGLTLTVQELADEQEAAAREFLLQSSLSAREITRGWLPTGAQKRLAARYAVWSDTTLEGYITWSGWSGADATIIRAAVNEQSEASVYAGRLLLTTAMESLVELGPLKLTITFPARQATLRDLAFSVGFRGEDGGESLVKVMLGRVITPARWVSTRADLATKCGIKLPSSIPPYRAGDQRIDILTPNKNRNYVSLDELETLLSPALLCLPGRPAVITPVQRRFSELLLKCSPQNQLLPQSSSSIYRERHYLSDPRTLGNFGRGVLILFYESLKDKGRGELIAIARAREAYLKPFAEFTEADFEQSVLSAETIISIGKAKMKTVTVFDSVFALPKPVTLKKLEKFDCGRPNDLITTHPIGDVQLQKILKEAFGNG